MVAVVDRAHINSWTPPEIAERAADRGVVEYSAEDLKEAREDLLEKLLAGDKFGRTDLELILEDEIQRNYASMRRSLYEHFAGIGNDSHVDEYDRASRAGEWMKRLVEAYLDANPDLIEERAAEIAAERLEDA
jgi:hypothetical protein